MTEDRRTIWKYLISTDVGKDQIIEMPLLSNPIHFDHDPSTTNYALWCEVHPNGNTVERTFCLFGTGWNVPDGYEYLGTLTDRVWVWHLYEKTS